jgi:hypothetical protein
MNTQLWLNIGLAAAATGFAFGWLRALLKNKANFHRSSLKQSHHSLPVDLSGDWLWEQDSSGRFTSIELKPRFSISSYFLMEAISPTH